MQCVCEKLRKDNGESLAEVLVAVLISAIGMVMLSSLIYAASHMVERGDASISKIYAGVNAMEEKKTATKSGQELVIKDENGNTFRVNIDLYSDEESGLMSYKKYEAAK